MNQVEQEIKSIAKAVGASLTRSGHGVPHSVLLHAIASALNKRNWQTLKSAVSTASGAPAEPKSSSPQAKRTEVSFGDKTKFMLRLAQFLGRPVNPVPKEEQEALLSALNQIGATVEGVLKWSGWNVPASLDLTQSKVDAGDFKATNNSIAKLLIRGASPTWGLQWLDIEVGYRALDGWFVTSDGVTQAYAQLERLVQLESTAPSPSKPLQSIGQKMQIAPVKAKFWTDDYVYELDFDAQPFLAHASDALLLQLLEEDLSTSDAADEAALYMRDFAKDPSFVEAFEYLEAIHRSPMKNPPGFEVRLDTRDAVNWLYANKPVICARYLCKRCGVTVFRGNTGPTAGKWGWTTSEDCIDASLNSEEAAYLAAMESLKLFEAFRESF